MRIAVIGAGIIGLTSAVAIKRSFPSDVVTIFSDEFTPNTTGDGSAGLWGPFSLTEASSHSFKWAAATHKWMESFWKSDLASVVGVTLTPVIHLFSDELPYNKAASWIQSAYGGIPLSQDYLKQLSQDYKKDFSYGLHYITFTCEPSKLLPWLTQNFTLMGGTIKQQYIRSFEDLQNDNFDVIINCTGLGASALAKDNSLVPIRGHVIRVKAPWITEAVLEDNYIIPNTHDVILGGIYQKGDYDTSIRSEDSKFIQEGCLRISPSLKNVQVLKQWVGLRPGRPNVRLEVEKIKISPGQNTTIIHNYGHSGSGVTLSWGCALNVVDILRDIRRENKSKL